MTPRIAGFLIFLLASTTFLVSATAQTTMQREEMRQRGELDEEEEQEESREVESSTTRQAQQTETQQEERSGPRPEDYVSSESYFVHIPGLRLDFGATFREDADALTSVGIGLGYMYAWEWELMIVRSASKLRIGGGPDLMFITSEWERLDAISGYLNLRASGIGPRGGLTLEGGFGGATGRGGIRPLFRAGAYLASDNFEIGYYFQAPLGSRPYWLTSHHLGLRLHIPMFHH